MLLRCEAQHRQALATFLHMILRLMTRLMNQPFSSNTKLPRRWTNAIQLRRGPRYATMSVMQRCGSSVEGITSLIHFMYIGSVSFGTYSYPF